MADVHITDVNCFVDSCNFPQSFVDDKKQVFFDASHPIGCTYVQYPGELEPSDVYNKNGILSEWIEVDFDGAFFRSEGSNASTFNSGLQLGQNAYHRHTMQHKHNMQHTHTRGSMEITGEYVPGGRDVDLRDNVDLTGVFRKGSTPHGNFGWPASGGGSFPKGSFKASTNWSGKTSAPSSTNTGGASTETTTAFGDDEFRPDNLTIKIWRRSA